MTNIASSEGLMRHTVSVTYIDLTWCRNLIEYTDDITAVACNQLTGFLLFRSTLDDRDLECRAVRNRCLHYIPDSYVPLRFVARQLEACLVNTRSDPRFQSRQQNSDKSTLADLNLRDRMNDRVCVFPFKIRPRKIGSRRIC